MFCYYTIKNRFIIQMWKISLLILLALGSSLDWTPLDSLINQAISEHAFPGAQITVANDKQILFRGNYGHLTYKHNVWQMPVNNNTKYDVASITKVMATSLNIMNMLSSSSIQLTDLVSKYVQNYDTNKKGNTTIANLLLHNAGLPYDYPGTLPDNQSQFMDYIRYAKPIYPVGTQVQYSNLGFYLLGKIIQKVTKKSFNAYFNQNKLFAGLSNSDFNPPVTQFPNIAPCEFDQQIRKRIVRGQCHQRVAYKYGGVAGHSGLFTTGDDVTRYMRILLNKGKLPQSAGRILPQTVVQKFTTKVQGLPYANTRAYGFDTSCPGSKMTNCFRHDGSTGIVAVADKSKNIIITLMCNRGHPDVKNTKVEQYKGKIADTIMTILGY